MNTCSDTPSNPFVGLRPFGSDEAVLFFGRTEQTTELLARLYRTHFLAVVGSSGCGKSSLVRAGLIPKLKAGMLIGDRDRWFIVTMKPGNHPRRNLAAALNAGIHEAGPFVDEKKFEEGIQASGFQAIAEVLTPVLQQADANLLLLVNQFEEIFRFTPGAGSGARKEEDADFVSLMLALAEQQILPIYVVITMRSDFLGDCDAFYGLPEALNRSQYLVPRLSRKQRREAIEGPIHLYGQTVESRLIDRILNDMGDESDQLPVMQHTLTRVWNHWQQYPDGPLDLADYEAVGTLKRALVLHAEEALEGMDQDELKLTEKIFRALTDTDQTNRRIRRPAHLSKIEDVTGATREKIKEIIERFQTEERCFLVMSEDRISGDFMVDISHESLIRQWERLNKWVDQESRDRSEYKRIVDSALRHKKKEGALWQDPDLQFALDWWNQAQPTAAWAERYGGEFDEAMSFLEQSKREKEEAETRLRELLEMKKRRRRQLAVVIAVFFLFLWGGIVIVVQQVHQAQQTRVELAKFQKAISEEMARTDISGALTVFGAGYGEEAREQDNRGLFTSLLEKHIFELNVGLSRAVAIVQNKVRGYGQHPELLSSLNGDIYLRPRNESRKFFALICGWNYFKGGTPLVGAVPDAQSMHKKLIDLGYESTLLLNPNRDGFYGAFRKMFEQAEKNCKELPFFRPQFPRGVEAVRELNPCQNVVLFVYLAGHGFVKDGTSYALPSDADGFNDEKAISVEKLRGRMAYAAAIQIIIADTSRGIPVRPMR